MGSDMRLTTRHGLLALLAGATLAACVPRKSSSVKSLIGSDDRQEINDEFSNAVIGTLHLGDGSAVCTAFASSAEEVITAAHCLAPGADATQYQFRTKKYGFRKLERLLQRGEKSDVAIFKAQQTTTDFLPVAGQQPDQSPTQLIGYDFRTLTLVRTSKGTIDLASAKGGVFTHNFDTLPGQSGSPLIQHGKVVAVHIGSLVGGKTNLAVGIQEIRNADVLSSYPHYAPENPVITAVVRSYQACAASLSCSTVFGIVANEVFNQGKSWVETYVEKVRTARKQAAEDKAFREHAQDRNSPENLSPGGWAGRDFGSGGDSRDTAIALLDVSQPLNDLIREVGLYIGASVELIFDQGFGREASDEEIKAMAQHIRNGASYGFLKATVFTELPIHERHGNNGTVSCDTFCAERRFTDAPGSCVSAKISTTGRGVLCSEVPGFVGGGELTCNCLGDGFNKPGNNGTVSCRDFCWGDQWGAIGNCLAAYKGESISCDAVTGSPQDCLCGGYGKKR